MALQKISPNELQKILRLHSAWLNGPEGTCADLREANLRGVNLREADLQGADLERAVLRYANLQEANLQSADLQGAALRGANLQGADLQGAICDSNIQKAWRLVGSRWLRSDIPWWVGHRDLNEIVLCDE